MLTMRSPKQLLKGRFSSKALKAGVISSHPPFVEERVRFITIQIKDYQHHSLTIAMFCFNLTVGFPWSVPVLN